MDFYADSGIPYTYTIELPDLGQYGFQLPESNLEEVRQSIVRLQLDQTNYLQVIQMALTTFLVKNFDCCFPRQILITLMLKIEKYGLRVLIWAEVRPLIDVDLQLNKLNLPKSDQRIRFLKTEIQLYWIFDPVNCIWTAEKTFSAGYSVNLTSTYNRNLRVIML